MAVSGLFISLLLLMWLAYRGISVLVLAPALAVLTVLFSGGEALLAHYTQIFMVKLGDFVTAYFPLFLFSAVFGKIMDSSGCALAIANYVSKKLGPSRAILAVVLSCAILTYGGVSLYVVAFAVYPIADELFRNAGTPKRFMPACIALGSFTFTMMALPGTPAIQNAIPSQYLGTNTFSAPVLGLISAAIMFVLGIGWLEYQLKLARAAGEGYGNHGEKIHEVDGENLPNIWLAIAPIVIVIAVNYLFVKCIIPNLDTSYLKEEKYGAVDIATVASNWSIIVALFCAIVFLIFTNVKRIHLIKCINQGAMDSLSPIFNTASVVGYGAVINCLSGFVTLRNWILSFSSGNPIISCSVVTAVLGAITGSASGGLSIALETMADKYIELANAAGISLDVIHRVIVIASGSMDILPHNGAVITLLAICGLKHKEAFKDIAISAMLPTTLITLAIIAVSAIFGSSCL